MPRGRSSFSQHAHKIAVHVYIINDVKQSVSFGDKAVDSAVRVPVN